MITRITKVEQFGSTKLEQSIIVHDLGVKYILSSSDGKCYVVPIDIKESQINDDNLITINPITLDVKDFKYVGQVKLVSIGNSSLSVIWFEW